MEQTIAQIGTLEQQINAIESANINRETLAAMEKAGDAMKQIHGKLTPQKVDETMYVSIGPFFIAYGTVPLPAFAEALYLLSHSPRTDHLSSLLQGQVARSECFERRDCQCHHWATSWGADRRRGSGITA
jgi:hypothetical protein